jgi:hypothetical protein
MRRAGLVTALLLAAASAAGQGAPTPDLMPRDVRIRFQTADLDQSGGLTSDEAIKGGYASQRFTTVDRDNDRIVTLAEIATYLADRASAWRRADANNDGAITRQEAEASPELRSSFSSADRDADGMLRQREHEAWSQTSLFQNTDLPFVVPNIFNKRF